MWWQTISVILDRVAAIVPIVTTLAACLIWWQVRVARKAMQAQTFLRIIDTAREITFSQGMDTIRSLRHNSYKAFCESESKEVQLHVRKLVDFMNDLNHLVVSKYVPEEQIREIYESSVKACNEHLLPWWLQGFREEHGSPLYYKNFEKLCSRYGACQST
jgi:hypothetical protein